MKILALSFLLTIGLFLLGGIIGNVAVELFKKVVYDGTAEENIS